MKFTKQTMRARAIRRLAETLFDNFEEGRDGHSRIFEVLVPDEFVIDGSSMSGGSYREHVVPCCVIRDGCMAMFRQGRSLDEVTAAIHDNLRIVMITTEEARMLDYGLKLKTKMPEGWVFGEGDPLARLTAAGIVLAAPTAFATYAQAGEQR